MREKVPPRGKESVGAAVGLSRRRGAVVGASRTSVGVARGSRGVGLAGTEVGVARSTWGVGLGEMGTGVPSPGMGVGLAGTGVGALERMDGTLQLARSRAATTNDIRIE
jgi:hypothetical protein